MVRASPGAQTVKRLSAMQETWVQSLGQEYPLEKEMATHSSILAWKIPWTEEPGRLQSMGLQRVGHDWATSLHFIHGDNYFNTDKILLHISKTTKYTKTNEGLERRRKLWRKSFHLFLQTQLTTSTVVNSVGYHSTLRPDPKSYVVFQRHLNVSGEERILSDLRHIFALTTLVL